MKVQDYNISTGHIETLKTYPDAEYGIATMYAQTVANKENAEHCVYVDIEDTEDECGI